MFEVGQTYPTREGGTCTILSIIEDTGPENWDAMCGIVTRPSGRKRHVTYSRNGRYWGAEGDAHDWDLTPPEPPFVVDEPVMVRDFDGVDWVRRYYAYRKDGTHYCWAGGATAWSTVSRDVTAWWLCRRPTPEELKCPS